MKLIFNLLFLTGHIHQLVGDSLVGNGEIFDFIVVGAGAGGCVVASRLAESGKHSVLLIEAGGFPNPDHEIPGLAFPYVMENAPDPFENIRFYPTVPQKFAGLGNNGVINFPAGRVLGGGTTVNVMVINRGAPHDYDNWAKLTGDASWSYANMLPYFKKFENYMGDFPTDQRGYSGPITVSKPYLYNSGLQEWHQAGIELGLPIADANGPQLPSFTALDFSRKNGRRVSAFRGYIEPLLQKLSLQSQQQSSVVHSRPVRQITPQKKNNLLILTNTQVNQIIFEGNHAVGVKYAINSTNGILKEGHAGVIKEIIVSAGVIESPVLLMKSGIGPKEVLDNVDIPTLSELPVGRNLHDHPTVGVTVIFGNRSAALDRNELLTNEDWKFFDETGDGVLASYGGASGQAFVLSSNVSPLEKKLGWPNLQLAPVNGNSGHPDLGGGVNITDLQEWEIPVTWLTVGGRPKSRGTVTLDVFQSPLVDFQYLAHPHDVQTMLEGVKIFIEICEKTKSFQQVGCRIPMDPLPACSHLTFRSDAYWICYIMQRSTQGYHGAGTCRMGFGPDDANAVVDTQLRVIGTDNLRIVDASIFPVITNANLQAPIYAIAEKASEILLAKWEG